MRKSSFLTFCFAFIPGAGQMYLGMMKRGVSIMLAFAVITALSGFLYLPFLAVALPVLWFYSFFDTFNIRGMTYEQRLNCEDKFLFNLDDAMKKDWAGVMKRRHSLIGWVCVGLGLLMMFQNFVRPLLWQLEEYIPWVGQLLRSVPTLVVAFAIILLGIFLVGGGRKKLPQPKDDDYVEYGGTNHE